MFPRLTVLYSYAHLERNSKCKEILKLLGSHITWLIDSGAFTVFSEKRRVLMTGEPMRPVVDLEGYINFCHEVKDHVWQYIAFDQIGDCDKTLENLQRMVSAGLRPMPVLIIGEDLLVVQDLMKINDRLCIAGGVTETRSWIWNRVGSAYKASDGRAKIHCLGYSKIPDVFHMDKMKSGDSSSYTIGAQYGWYVTYSPTRGFIKARYDRLNLENRVHYSTVAQLLKCNITPEMMRDPKMNIKLTGIPALSAVAAYLRYLDDCRSRNGHLYFFAISGMAWLSAIIACLAGMNGEGWDYRESRQTYSRLSQSYNAGVHEYVVAITEILERTTTWQDRFLLL